MSHKDYLNAYNLIFNWVSNNQPNLGLIKTSKLASDFAKMYCDVIVSDQSDIDSNYDTSIYFSWKYAPSWAKYAAMDEDGAWYFYENEPQIASNYWFICNGDFSKSSINISEESWKSSLKKRPE